MNIAEMGSEFIWWIGTVVSRDDPLLLGRVKVRVFRDHGTKENIPDDELPWAQVIMPVTEASTAVSGGNAVGTPAVGVLNGSTVMGFYADGVEKQIPIVMGTIVGAPLGVVTNASPQTMPTDMPFEAKGIKTTKDFNFGELPGFAGFEPVDALLGASTAIYPYNKVRVTESGHLQEMDDTPGQERIYTRHRTGSYMIFAKQGDVAIKTINNNWDVIGNSKLQYVRESYVSMIGGCYVVSAKKAIMLQTEDSISIQAGKFISISAGITMTLSAPIILLN